MYVQLKLCWYRESLIKIDQWNISSDLSQNVIYLQILREIIVDLILNLFLLFI